MFSGKITISYSKDSFTVDSTYDSLLSVEYDSIESLEYRENFDFGSRIFGFSSAKLLSGSFQNDEFGTYTLYSYTNSDAVVIIKSGNKILVIGGIDSAATKEIYDTLMQK